MTPKKKEKKILIQSVDVKNDTPNKNDLTAPINEEEFEKMLLWLKGYIKSQTKKKIGE